MLIIPAIDILDGKVVRLTKGDFNSAEVYNNSPLEQAKIFESFGFKWVHIVDLKGSKDGSGTIQKTIEEIKSKTGLKVETGGGVRKTGDMNDLFSSGVDKVIIGSMPVINKEEFIRASEMFDAERIIIAADTLNNKIMIKGWQEKSSLELNTHIMECMKYSIKNFLITDINTDGVLMGPNIKLYSEIKACFPRAFIIASGGVSEINDIIKLKESKADAVVIGKAIYSGRIKLWELSKIAL